MLGVTLRPVFGPAQFSGAWRGSSDCVSMVLLRAAQYLILRRKTEILTVTARYHEREASCQII